MGRLFGRAEEMARAGACLDAALQGEGATLLLVGEPGIGKSRLAREIGELAEERSARVVWGRCWEGGGAPAFWPWIEALRELGEDLFEGLPHGGAEGGQDQRFAVFRRATDLLRAAAARAPLVIVLDDVHVADVPSLHLLLFLARSLRGAPLLVVVTAREVESRASPERADLFARIAREATVLSLPRLGRDDVAAWIAGRAEDRSVDDVYRLTEGNPLFVEEVLRVGGAPVRATHGLSAVLDEHLARLSAAARALLEQASVLGRDLDLDAVATLAGAPVDEADALLREAEGAGVLADEGRGRRSFVHVLLRDRLYDALAPTRRAALHWRAAQVIEEAGGDPVTVAHHLLAGASAGDPAHAARAALRGAARATGQLAFEAAIALSERVLALPPRALEAPLRCEAELADASMRIGDLVRGRAAADRASELARALGDGDALARAALVHTAELVLRHLRSGHGRPARGGPARPAGGARPAPGTPDGAAGLGARTAAHTRARTHRPPLRERCPRDGARARRGHPPLLSPPSPRRS